MIEHIQISFNGRLIDFWNVIYNDRVETIISKHYILWCEDNGSSIKDRLKCFWININGPSSYGIQWRLHYLERVFIDGVGFRKNYHILKEYKRIHIAPCYVLIQEGPTLFILSPQPRVIMKGKQIKYEAYVVNRYQARVVRH